MGTSVDVPGTCKSRLPLALLSDGCGWAFLDLKVLDALFAVRCSPSQATARHGVCATKLVAFKYKPSMYTTRDMKATRRPFTVQGVLPFGEKIKSCRSRIVQKIPSPHTRFVVWWCGARVAALPTSATFAPHTHTSVCSTPGAGLPFHSAPHHPLQGA